MDVTFYGDHLEITDAIRTHTEEKLAKLERHNPKLLSAKVTFSIERGTHIAETILHEKGHEFYAKSEHDNLYKSIDKMVDKLDRQVQKENHIRRHC